MALIGIEVDLNILFLIPELGYGGAETALLRLATALSAKHLVQVAVFQERYEQSAYAHYAPTDGLVIHRIDGDARLSRFSRWVTRRRNLIALKKREKIDVTVSFLTGPNFLNVISRFQDRVVISYRGSRRYDAHAGRKKWRLYSATDRLVCKLADNVVCVSRGLSSEIATATGLAGSAKFLTIPPGIDSEEMIARASEPIESEFEALGQTRMIVSIGRQSVEKGFDELIRVFAKLKHRIQDAKLLLIGDGPERENLKRLAVDLGLVVSELPSPNADVIMPGFKKKPSRYIRLGRTFVLPSRNEGFGNVLLEALAAGKPVTASDVPWGPRDLFERPISEISTAYPRENPHQSSLGWLMPRIDDPANHATWIAVLSKALSSSFDPNLGKVERLVRLRHFDLEAVLPRWECLFISPDPAVPT